MHGVGSPGGAFKFTENALVECLERLPRWSQMVYGDTVGRRVVFRTGDEPVNALQILDRYYAQDSNGANNG